MAMSRTSMRNQISKGGKKKIRPKRRRKPRR